MASRGHGACKARQRTGGAGSAASAWILAAACAGLLLLQLLASAHGIVHPATQGVASHASESIRDDHHHEHDRGELAGLFDSQHDEGSAQCQLLDQLAHADALSAPIGDWTFAAPQAEIAAAVPAPQRASVGRGYHARGPPSFLA
jgi:hypothetical protein